jgi:hypothetical protein
MRVTEAYDVPALDSEEAKAFARLLGRSGPLQESNAGFLVGYAAGKAQAKLPPGARVVRVVVVAETPEGGPT